MPKQTKNNQAGNKARKMVKSLQAMSFLREIHAEIAPKKSLEILPEITGPEWRTRGANRRATDTAGKGEFAHVYALGQADLDSDLSLSNSLLCETPRAIFEEKASE